MQLLHYYVQLGWSIDDFLNEPLINQLFYRASMMIRTEEIQEAMGGSD
ncbi:hypothetical protein SAMN05216507_11277 [[Clostridium] innocuum]|nr:hypothetical protein [[Clostridium] innocuum]SFL62420.1 hypothetical protein SAMN05216507_11277 [[Clostridium] innocuum]